MARKIPTQNAAVNLHTVEAIINRHFERRTALINGQNFFFWQNLGQILIQQLQTDIGPMMEIEEGLSIDQLLNTIISLKKLIAEQVSPKNIVPKSTFVTDWVF